MNRFWEFCCGDVEEFWIAAWNFISKLFGQVSTKFRQGTIWVSLDSAWDAVVLAIAKNFGEPHHYSMATGWIMFGIFLYLLAMLFFRAKNKRKAGNPMSASAIVMWIAIALAVLLNALTTTLVAFLIFTLGWWIVRAIILTKALITGGKKSIAGGVIGLLFCSGVGYLLIRAAYLSSLLY